MPLTTINTTTGAEPVLIEDEGYINAMVAKAEGTTPSPSEPEQTPPATTLLAGKYKSVEELERGYKELQKAFSQRTPDDTPPAPEPTPTPVDDPLSIPEEPTDPAGELLESKGLDLNTFSEEYATTGALSDTSYDTLEKAGISREIVDQYIEGQKLIVEQRTYQVFDSVGGKDEYVKIVQWAAKNLPKAEVGAYNDIIQSGDIVKMQMASKGLKVTYEESFGKTPQLIHGSAASYDSADTFRSKAEMTAAMADKRYEKDPAYREDVMNKIARSNIF